MSQVVQGLRLSIVLVLVCVTAGHILEGDEEAKEGGAKLSCGPLSLFYILHFEGYQIGLAELAAYLPEAGHGDYSLKNLRDAARECGLSLTGVRMTKDDRSIDRPILAFVKRGTHGHFLVVRPIGHTGKLAQVLDGDRPPVIIDKANLFASSEWTGLALVPSRVRWGWLIVSLLIALMSLGVAYGISRRLSYGSREYHLTGAS